MREVLHAAPVPPGLAESIRRRRSSSRVRSTILQLAAAAVLLVGLGVYWVNQRTQSARFVDYRHSMAQLIQHGYRMSYLTDNPEAARRFLRANQAPADFELPATTADTKLLGCATLSWNGNPVSLLCFRRPSADLWLFVSPRAALPDAPALSSSMEKEAGNLHTASWTAGDIVYLAATRGEGELRHIFP
jgi:anti-sigma-K factor RskA